MKNNSKNRNILITIIVVAGLLLIFYKLNIFSIAQGNNTLIGLPSQFIYGQNNKLNLSFVVFGGLSSEQFQAIAFSLPIDYSQYYGNCPSYPYQAGLNVPQLNYIQIDFNNVSQYVINSQTYYSTLQNNITLQNNQVYKLFLEQSPSNYYYPLNYVDNINTKVINVKMYADLEGCKTSYVNGILQENPYEIPNILFYETNITNTNLQTTTTTTTTTTVPQTSPPPINNNNFFSELSNFFNSLISELQKLFSV